ncbi:MAG: class I tRNA ligase family protein [Thermodesulfobacteriota bacterium]
MKLFLQNTLSGSKDIFKPRSGSEVKLFTCGPSVYSLPHVGNFRTYLYEDVLQRALKSLGYSVKRMINFTDVEDKAVAEAEKRGLSSLAQLTGSNEERFLKNAAELKIRLPEQIPRSSTSVEQAVYLIRILLEKGHAYWHQGDVFFDPLTFPDFGKLYGLDLSRWPGKRVRFRRDTYPGQRWNLGDFILWHGGKPGDPFVWETGIGPGRPAWNIQDPAMISEHLGYELDICCGGVDNLYRHHDYNIALMESVSGRTFAPFWLHGELLLVNGSKMSKSKGNIVYPKDLFQKKWTPGFLRYFLLSVHYRSKLNLDSRNIDAAWSKYTRLQELIRELQDGSGKQDTGVALGPDWIQSLFSGVYIHLYDDLDVPQATDYLIRVLEQMHALLRDERLGAGELEEVRSCLGSLDQVLGFLFE